MMAPVIMQAAIGESHPIRIAPDGKSNLSVWAADSLEQHGGYHDLGELGGRVIRTCYRG